MNPTTDSRNNMMEPIMRAFQQLSPGSQGAVAALVRQLAESEGIISVEQAGNPGLRSPAEGIPLWLAKLKAERYSARTVHMYGYLAGRYRRFLQHFQHPVHPACRPFVGPVWA